MGGGPYGGWHAMPTGTHQAGSPQPSSEGDALLAFLKREPAGAQADAAAAGSTVPLRTVRVMQHAACAMRRNTAACVMRHAAYTALPCTLGAGRPRARSRRHRPSLTSRMRAGACALSLFRSGADKPSRPHRRAFPPPAAVRARRSQRYAREPNVRFSPLISRSLVPLNKSLP